MICYFCKKDGARPYKNKSYFGTSSHVIDGDIPFHPECYTLWWNDLTWHLDVLDERMNSNVHFVRTQGEDGTYKGKPAKAHWNGLEARHFLGEYEYEHRRPHPETCKECSLFSNSPKEE